MGSKVNKVQIGFTFVLGPQLDLGSKPGFTIPLKGGIDTRGEPRFKTQIVGPLSF